MTLPTEADLMLPNGYWRQGVCLRDARVRAISEGEVAMGGLQEGRLPIEQISALLARCVTHLGGSQCEGSEQIRSLPMGDREALLLHIRRLTFGDRIPCTLHCPSCAALMEFELHAHELLLPGEQHPAQYREERFPAGGATWHVRFRVPCGADLEPAIHTHGAATEAATAVLNRCVEWARRVDAPGNESFPAAQWPPELAEQIAARMSALDPQAEIILQLRCPTCGHEFSSLFDVGDYFLRELADAERQLYYDVHRLALAYHWSETEILNMMPRKRKLYLDLLEGASGLE